MNFLTIISKYCTRKTANDICLKIKRDIAKNYNRSDIVRIVSVYSANYNDLNFNRITEKFKNGIIDKVELEEIDFHSNVLFAYVVTFADKSMVGLLYSYPYQGNYSHIVVERLIENTFIKEICDIDMRYIVFPINLPFFPKKL